MFWDSLVSPYGKVIGSDEGIKLGSTDVKVIVTIFWYIDLITLGLDVGTELGSFDGSFDGSNGVKLLSLYLGDSFLFTNEILVSSDEGIKLGFTYDEVLGTIFRDSDEITPGVDVGTELEYLYGTFDSYNFGKLESLFFWDSLWSTDGKVLGSDEGIKMGSTNGEVLGNIL